MDNRLYIAEPPLYKVTDKNNPFVIDKEDYVNRYATSVAKEYKIGYKKKEIEYIEKSSLLNLLMNTSEYVDKILMLSKHYKIHDRIVELIIEEYALYEKEGHVDPHHLVKRINEEYPEIYFDERDQVLKGVIDGKYQLFEMSERFMRKSEPLIALMKQYGPSINESMILKSIKTGSETELSLLGILKALKHFQPNIEVRLKGLGEASKEDMKTTVMDPNTRTLIRVQISDIENDMAVFQMLRGDSQVDRQNRKVMMANFDFDVSLIDT